MVTVEGLSGIVAFVLPRSGIVLSLQLSDHNPETYIDEKKGHSIHAQ